MTSPDPVGADTARCAADHVTRRVPLAHPGDPAARVLDALRGGHFDSASTIVVVDGDRLVGLAPTERVLDADPDTPVGSLVAPGLPTVAPSTDQEQAAWQAVQHGVHTIAVVDRGEFVGLIPSEALLAILSAEHDEDMVRLGGFLNSKSTAQTTTLEPVLRRLWHRLPWLIVGLAGALLAAIVVGSFEATLADTVLIAFFVPGVVYLADAIGTQTEALVIRGLAVGVGIRRVAVREIVTGVLLGTILGTVAFLLVGVLWQDWRVALAVGVSLFAASSIATAVALVLPWLIDRMGRDPAFGSGPLATVLQDLLTVAIYLATATVLTR
ncbi:magnesium transporter [Dietzia sp. UBA5065]|jgi:magnesium transporter|uniref:magnesium transporter n=1 Tax=Dietzia sp. UBA5065 TaxID=1946422 RepID=UPI0025C3CD18|nr:magnesium transporter [Dietzia sp. UBA5065]HMT48696.1 magnesium transporter [Dietzia sp.]